MDIMSSILDCVNNTPIILLQKYFEGFKPRVLAKAEFLNPGGSIKDRIGLAMIEDAERKGLLKPGGTIVEPTAGNTGIGLLIAAIARGYKCIFTVPDKMSMEKIKLMKAFGAEVIICPTAVPADSPDSYYEMAKRIASEIPNSFIPNQYYNSANPEAHYRLTGREIWEQMEGKIDYFIAGMGTGGTITGVAKYLKEKNPNIKIIGVDTEGSIYSYHFYKKEIKNGDIHPFLVEGIGEDIIPSTVDFSLIDEIITISDKEAFLTARELAKKEAILAGGSSGCAIAAAKRIADRHRNEDINIVVILPDTGRNYLTKFYDDEWLEERVFLPERIKSEAEFIKNIYEKTAEDYDKIISGSRFYQFLSLIKDLNIKGSERVFDYGCGPGTLSVEIARRLSEGVLTGIDFSQKMIEISRRKASMLGLKNAEFFVADVCKFKPANRIADVVVSSMVIHLVTDVNSYLDSVNFILKENSKFGIIAPYFDIYQEFKECFSIVVKKYSGYLPDSDFEEILHIKMRSEKEYETLLKNSGFRVEKSYIIKTMETISPDEYLYRMKTFSNDAYLNRLPDHIKSLFIRDLRKTLANYNNGDLKATESALIIIATKEKEEIYYEI